MLRLGLCDFSDTYFAVKRKISAKATNDAKRRNKELTSKNNAPFRSCISNIINTFIDNTEDLEIFYADI